MPDTPNQSRIFRFGLFELDAGTGELRKDGKSRPRLQGQPLEVLLCLLDRRGELVTREELRQRLWPADTFVDYDHSLNTAVNKVREALNDSADNPRFIQTVPRRGYRFIAAIEVAENATISNGPSAISEPVAEPVGSLGKRQGPSSNPDSSSGSSPSSSRGSRMLSDPRDLPSAARGLVRLLFSLIQIMYLCFYIASLASLRRLDTALEQMLVYPKWLFVVVVVTALVGIPVRLYLLSAAAFGYQGLTRRFLSLFPVLFPLDELWALAPFLLVNQIGIGFALAATAALLYVPFSQRSLLLMGEGNPKPE